MARRPYFLWFSLAVAAIAGLIIFQGWRRSETNHRQALYCSVVKNIVRGGLQDGIPLHLAEQRAITEAPYNPDLSPEEVKSWGVSYEDATVNLEDPRMRVIFTHPTHKEEILYILSPWMKGLLPKIRR